jgi:hypothetical protein
MEVPPQRNSRSRNGAKQRLSYKRPLSDLFDVILLTSSAPVFDEQVDAARLRVLRPSAICTRESCLVGLHQ